ncbi:NADP-dependent oxidoreductase domain-containing protein [Lipomyces tetrasporus]
MSLRNLKTDYVDLYYQHRVDQRTPIEVTIGALAELVEQGKIRYIRNVSPITAITVEYSLFSREIESYDLLGNACRELAVTVVAYSPPGRGILVDKKPSDFVPSDSRARMPRMNGEN